MYQVAVFTDRDDDTGHVCANGLCGTVKPTFGRELTLASDAQLRAARRGKCASLAYETRGVREANPI